MWIHLAQSPILAVLQVNSVFECSAGAINGSTNGKLGSGHCTLTQKLHPSAHISLSSSKKVCFLLF
jgi:hypothetical protein